MLQELMWKAILELMVAYNFNHGPFGSKAWARLKTATLRRCIDANTCDSNDFDNMWVQFAIDNQLPHDTYEDKQFVFKQLALMRSFNETGPVLNRMRWKSIAKVHGWYRPELEGFRLIDC